MSQTPTIDFQREFGVNAGYVETLFERWQREPDGVDPEWRTWFERLTGTEAKDAAPPAAAAPAAAPEEDEAYERERLKGIASKIAENMNASLGVPTATSVRTIPVKVMVENRRIVNGHMRVRALGKASFTHFIAYALVRALRDQPNMQSFFREEGGAGWKLTPRQVNLGLAVDVETPRGRSLVVPNVKGAESMTFREFRRAYEDVVRRARDGKLDASDFRGTTVTLTNPGGLGTHLSVPRLMEGQGLILGTGAIGVPTESAAMSVATLADLAIGPVMTVTSTYDHRVIQGAESGVLLRRLDELLQGADDFWNEIFRDIRVPWRPVRPHVDTLSAPGSDGMAEKQAKVNQMIAAYRSRGCRIADLDPLEYKPDPLPSLDPAFYGFTLWDLDREFLCGGLDGKPSMSLRDILTVLANTYCRRWTIEYMHIANRVRKQWIRDRVELRRDEETFTHEDRLRILKLLFRAQNLERFLHTRYVGNKRFSLEGGDTCIPALATLIDRAAEGGVEKVVLGMAHRGRLNVLANILNKSYDRIFSEFEGVLLPLSSEGSGDVKYHLGQVGVYTTSGGKQVEVVLCANPSHLEAVDPVVCGMSRGFQDALADKDRKRVLSVLIHGDAAFTGQGVVAETLNMSNLPANSCGGTIHLVLNNQIGFTAGPKDLRSTYYCTDVAKGIEAP
ncbi:MAG: 2-oxo acid dehydrogenase subunit E2, partial [Planctomycetota bacterium JB042]